MVALEHRNSKLEKENKEMKKLISELKDTMLLTTMGDEGAFAVHIEEVVEAVKRNNSGYIAGEIESPHKGGRMLRCKYRGTEKTFIATKIL
jgi:hypothetical protein